MTRRLGSVLVSLLLTVTATFFGTLAMPGKALADGCYTWSRQLSEGTSGDDVKQLQIRISGYPGFGGVLAVDGQFGAGTKAAVVRFQQAYGLSDDGVAGPNTFAKIYALQDDDCTPVNFSYAELNDCNSTWSGGNVSAATAKANALLSMWKLQAMRHAMGDQPIRVTSGFRSVACNNAAGGASSSRHLYGDAVDLGVGAHTLCQMAQQARNHGFAGILGPGYPDHGDHVHVDHRSSRFWSAPNCGVSSSLVQSVDPVEGTGP
jgi:zinc D-Ala-D-Ala carboxypeptidase